MGSVDEFLFSSVLKITGFAYYPSLPAQMPPFSSF
jgi:hypothetical protein